MRLWDSETLETLETLFLPFPSFSCLFFEVHTCHASCYCICKIYKNRVVTFALVCLSENVVVVGKISPLQPPPSLPRRGGTVTIDYLVIICRGLIISHLSVNGVIFISPTGENERGLMMITAIIHLHLRSVFVMPLVIVVAIISRTDVGRLQ